MMEKSIRDNPIEIYEKVLSAGLYVRKCKVRTM